MVDNLLLGSRDNLFMLIIQKDFDQTFGKMETTLSNPSFDITTPIQYWFLSGGVVATWPTTVLNG